MGNRDAEVVGLERESFPVSERFWRGVVAFCLLGPERIDAWIVFVAAQEKIGGAVVVGCCEHPVRVGDVAGFCRRWRWWGGPGGCFDALCEAGKGAVPGLEVAGFYEGP